MVLLLNVIMYISAGPAIHRGEVKLYGVFGRGDCELLVVDASNRP